MSRFEKEECFKIFLMTDTQDIELLIKSRTPIIAMESHEELRVLTTLLAIAKRLDQPVFRWSVTDGLQRLDIKLPAQSLDPAAVLRHIKKHAQIGVYVLLDFHPYLVEPVHMRLLKDIAVSHGSRGISLVLLSHQVELPGELTKFAAKTKLALPTDNELMQAVREVANEWSQHNEHTAVKAKSEALKILIKNLKGLTLRDAQRLARNAIYDDGAITASDIPEIQKAKYQLLNREGVLSFEYDTAKFSDIGGFRHLKTWLEHRRDTFYGVTGTEQFDQPKGVLLLGVQGCGKSLAAKAIAGSFAVPLLRMDFGSIYNKYHGETERNLRESLQTAEAMAPCILWIDEIEKGIASGDNDGGTSKRVLATLLTWMAEKKQAVFLVATANDITSLPPELVRKGRFDEIFFVDLPVEDVRAGIFDIHLRKRQLVVGTFDLPALAAASDGFSGAEIEQSIVSALYGAHAAKTELSQQAVLDAIQNTKPLSVLMAEKILYLRSWAQDRTVPCD